MYYWVCESYRIDKPVGIFQVRFCSRNREAAKKFLKVNKNNYSNMLYLLERDYKIK